MGVETPSEAKLRVEISGSVTGGKYTTVYKVIKGAKGRFKLFDTFHNVFYAYIDLTDLGGSLCSEKIGKISKSISELAELTNYCVVRFTVITTLRNLPMAVKKLRRKCVYYSRERDAVKGLMKLTNNSCGFLEARISSRVLKVIVLPSCLNVTTYEPSISDSSVTCSKDLSEYLQIACSFINFIESLSRA